MEWNIAEYMIILGLCLVTIILGLYLAWEAGRK